jgi:carbon storage regulator
MLVLTRKIGESIRVGEGIIIKVLETGGGQAKIGITAPPQMPIHREEIYLRIREENLAAAKGHKAVESLKGALTGQLEGLPKSGDTPTDSGSG